MCGRYTFFMRGRDLEDRVEEDLEETVDWRDSALDRYQPSYNVEPSTLNPVVDAGSQAKITLQRWGLVPHWADSDDDWNLINARSESVDDKPVFREAFESRRCLVPAQGFYEWSDREGPSIPYRFVPRDDPDDLLYLAGVYESWEPSTSQSDLSSYGGGTDDADTGEAGAWFGDVRYSILTEPATRPVEEVHDRMPVMLTSHELPTWLTGEPKDARKLLDNHVVPEDYLRGYRVSREVNSPANDRPELLAEVSG